MNDKEFDELKKKTLPVELQEHFSKNRKVTLNNIKKFQDLTKQLSSIKATDGEKAILAFILDLGQALYGSADVSFEQTEIAFFGLYILREEIDNMKNALKDHGIKIEGLLKYDNALSFIDNYIKRSSRDTSLE